MKTSFEIQVQVERYIIVVQFEQDVREFFVFIQFSKTSVITIVHIPDFLEIAGNRSNVWNQL